METNKRWSLLGVKPQRPRPNVIALVIAFLIAFETFIAVGDGYPLYMSLLAIGASLWAALEGIRAKAYLAFSFIPVGAIWLNPILGGDWFNQVGTELFISHALLAMLLAVSGYTYQATERTS